MCILYISIRIDKINCIDFFVRIFSKWLKSSIIWWENLLLFCGENKNENESNSIKVTYLFATINSKGVKLFVFLNIL